MKNLNFPVNLQFKISSLANDFTAKDVNGDTVAYVRQKMFKLKEAITVYADDSRSKVEYTIAADRWIDFSAAYSFKNAEGKELGKIARKGWKSIWKSEYELIDQNQKMQYHIREENAWIKVLDALFSEIPILGILTGYFFNPVYNVTDMNNELVVRLKKEPSFWGRKFIIEKIKDIDQDDAERIVLGTMMMVLLERRRG